MKKIVLAVCLCALLAGCSILPKNVEFGQKKVKPVPAKTEKAKEFDRKAIYFVNKKVNEALTAAFATKADKTVVTPLSEAKPVSEALVVSVGPPKPEWTGNATNLAKEVNKNTAVLNEKLDDYRDNVKPLEGKKIEGTGFIQMGYFTYLGILIGLAFLIKFAYNIFGTLYPPVGAAGQLLKVPAKIVARGFSEVIEGGEHFLSKVDHEFEPAVAAKISAMFKSSHMEKQSRDVQTIVDTITK